MLKIMRFGISKIVSGDFKMIHNFSNKNRRCLKN